MNHCAWAVRGVRHRALRGGWGGGGLVVLWGVWVGGGGGGGGGFSGCISDHGDET